MNKYMGLLELKIEKFSEYFSVFCKGRYWLLYAVLISFFLSVLVAFPEKDQFYPTSNGEFMGVMKKAETPFTQINFAPGSHSSKLSFRMTVPVIIHVFHFNILAVKITEVVFGLLLFYLTGKLIYRAASNRVFAFWAVLAVGQIWAGMTAFIETRGMFDGIAIVFLLLALFFEKPFAIGILTFTASFTDERALVASIFVLAYHMNMSVDMRDFKGLPKALFAPKCAAVLLAWALYLISRLVLSVKFGLQTDTGGVGLDLFVSQILNFFPGLWSGLEGFWLIPALALLELFRRKQYTFTILYFAGLSMVAVTAMSVIDITRSMAYLYPAVFIGFKILSGVKSDRFLRNMLFATLLISFLWPCYYFVGETDCLLWEPSLLVRIIDSILVTGGFW